MGYDPSEIINSVFSGTKTADLYAANDANTPGKLLTVSDEEAILRVFYDNAPLLMGVVELCDNDSDVRFLLVNRAVGRWFGRLPETIHSKRALEINSPPAVVSQYIAAFIKARQTKQSVQFEYAREQLSGEVRFVEVKVSFIASEPDGNRFLFVGEDTTVRNEALRKMRLLQSAVENAHDAILITQAPTAPFNPLSGSQSESPRILYVNPAFEQLTGYTTSEVIGQTPQFLMPPGVEYRPKDALLQGKPVQKEMLLRRKSGEDLWVEMSVRPAPAAPDTSGERHWIGVLRDVTARKQAQAQMRLRDRAIESSSCGIAIVDAQQAHRPIVYVNPAYEKITGYTADEVLGKHPGDVFGGNTPDSEARQAVHEAMENECELHITRQDARKDGSPMWRELHMSPVRDEETGKVTHFVSVQNDITEQKEAEEKLILRERAVAAASNGIVISDARRLDLPIVYCNPAFEKMTGYTKEEAVGRNCRFLQGADNDLVAREEIRYALQNARDCVVILKNYRKNGEVFWNELSISPVRDAQGKLTHFVGVQNDITERQNAQDALLEAEARLRYVVQNLPLVVFAINRDGVFTFSDGKGLETLGLKPGEVVGRSVKEVYPHEAALHERLSRAMGGEDQTFTADVEGTIFETTYNPQWGTNGTVTGIIGFALDVTKRTHLEAQVLQSDKLAAIGQLVAGVAHEINNPLAAISGSAQLLALHPDEEVQADAHAIKAMTDRAVNVVRSLLTFARAPKGVAEDRSLCTLGQLAQDTLHLTQFSLRKADIDVHLFFAPDELNVYVNGGQIQQIILNLLTNAEHALRQAPEGSDRHIIITTASEVENGHVSLTVADNGCGITPAIQKRIFDPFFTTKDVGEGTGLGLSICHGIAVAHEGTLYVESSEGVGAAFTLRLPAARAAAIQGEDI